MQKRETRPAFARWTGLEGKSSFEHLLSSPISPSRQASRMGGYRIDSCLTVFPIWRHHHE
jgi:hypothetical protein